MAAFSGISVFVALAIPNTIVMKFAMGYIMKVKRRSDARLKTLTECLNGMRLVKLMGWERRMHDRVNEKRKMELAAIKRQRILFSVVGIISRITPVLINATTLVAYCLLTGTCGGC